MGLYQYLAVYFVMPNERQISQYLADMRFSVVFTLVFLVLRFYFVVVVVVAVVLCCFCWNFVVVSNKNLFIHRTHKFNK